MDKRRTTIFRQLILNIVFPVVTALVLLAILNYWNSKINLVKWNEIKNRFITEEIKNIHIFQDLALEILETNLDTRTKTLSEKLVKHYFRNTKNIDKVDLNQIRKELGMDSEREDIYIIDRDGRVINTTFKQDKNLNLFSFGEQHQKYLISVFDSGVFVSERIAVEAKTKRLKKYTYQPTIDKKYIVELGVYSERADKIVEFIKNRIENLKKSEISDRNTTQESIIDVDIYVGADKPFSLYKSTSSTITHPEIVERVFKNKNSESIVENINNKRIHYEYIYFERTGTSLYKNAVIQIVSDRTAEIKLIKSEFIKFIIIFGITIIIVILLIYRKTLIITDPIRKLINNVNRITSGHLEERAQVVGNNEISSLSESFNVMIDQIENYYNELEQKVRERTYEIYQQKEEIEAQRDAIEEQLKQLEDNNFKLEKIQQQFIIYQNRVSENLIFAKKIQTLILPSQEEINKIFPEVFVLYKPKSTISGDFFAVNEINKTKFFTIFDCPFQDIPTSLVSLITYYYFYNALYNQSDKSTSEILKVIYKELAQVFIESTKVFSFANKIKIGLCSFSSDYKKIIYSANSMPALVVNNNNISLIGTDNIPMGYLFENRTIAFKNNELYLNKGDMIYFFTDGIINQIGGEYGKKYMINNLKQFLLDIYKEPIDKQKALIENNFHNWKKNYPQIDDLTIVGIRI